MSWTRRSPSRCFLLLLPLLLLIALLVALDSRGPVLYSQDREGWRGRRFRCWKFRTMHLTAESQERELRAQNQVDGPQFKMADDPRLTRIGRLLRATSLDELPQILNVLRGEMAFVGPRPSPFRENQLCVDWRNGRLSVRPGITGLWQVCRHDRDNGDFHQWIEYDLLYVRRMSPALDIRILIATVLTLGGRRSAPLSWVLRQLRPRPIDTRVAHVVGCLVNDWRWGGSVRIALCAIAFAIGGGCAASATSPSSPGRSATGLWVTGYYAGWFWE